MPASATLRIFKLLRIMIQSVPDFEQPLEALTESGKLLLVLAELRDSPWSLRKVISDGDGKGTIILDESVLTFNEFGDSTCRRVWANARLTRMPGGVVILGAAPAPIEIYQVGPIGQL